MIRLSNIPKAREEWYEIYGNPLTPDGDGVNEEWVEENLQWYETPFVLYIPWRYQAINWIRMHKHIGPAVIDAFQEMLDRKGEDYIIHNEHHFWYGCWNVRAQKWSDEVSTHAFAAAVDINAHLAPFNAESNQPAYVIEAFVSRGFTWGGNTALFEYIDGCHFQAGRGL